MWTQLSVTQCLCCCHLQLMWCMFGLIWDLRIFGFVGMAVEEVVYLCCDFCAKVGGPLGSRNQRAVTAPQHCCLACSEMYASLRRAAFPDCHAKYMDCLQSRPVCLHKQCGRVLTAFALVQHRSVKPLLSACPCPRLQLLCCVMLCCTAGCVQLRPDAEQLQGHGQQAGGCDATNTGEPPPDTHPGAQARN